MTDKDALMHYKCCDVSEKLFSVDKLFIDSQEKWPVPSGLQILLERYAYSEIGGTFILV